MILAILKYWSKVFLWLLVIVKDGKKDKNYNVKKIMPHQILNFTKKNRIILSTIPMDESATLPEKYKVSDIPVCTVQNIFK